MTEQKVYAKQASLFESECFGYTHIEKEYDISVPDDGCMIAESFGIGNKHTNVIADIEVPDDFSVLYITGESGSGKSTLLKEYTRIHGYSPYVMSEKDMNKPLFLLAGSDDEQQNKMLQILTSVGLSDAVLWLNTYRELSDSQQARLEVALNILNKEVVIVDEFLSTLDRETALPVAYSIQKAIRKYGKKLICATAHMDLEDYLKPDVVVRGMAFPSEWKVETGKVWGDSNPIVGNLRFHYGDKFEYQNASLGSLHYKGKYTGGVKEYLFAHHNNRLVALLVSTYNMHTGGRRISRLVVHPSYRGGGVGKEIVKKYISDYPNTDVLATMALYNPIFEKAGMKRLEDTVIAPPNGLEKKLQSLGFESDKWGDKYYLNSFVEDKSVREIISEYSNKASSVVCPGGIRIKNDEIQQKIMFDKQTASRVLFSFRPRKMARYINVLESDVNDLSEDQINELIKETK